MKLRYRILGVIAIVLAAAGLSLGLFVSHTTPCGPTPPRPLGATAMKAAVRHCYGSPDVVRYEDVAKPAASDRQVLVRVHAVSVNPYDWHFVEGTPFLIRTDPAMGFGAPRNPRF
jgi:hypothetical protein